MTDDLDHALREATLPRPAVGESGGTDRELADSHLLLSDVLGVAPVECGQGRRAPFQTDQASPVAQQPRRSTPQRLRRRES